MKVITTRSLSVAVAFCLLMLAARLGAVEPMLKSGIDRANFDLSVKPGQDFFEYANGTWIKKNPIPADYTRWGVFTKLHDDNLVALREILDGLKVVHGKRSPDQQKLHDFYRTATDEKQLEKQGVAPLADELKKISQVNSVDDLISLVGHFQSHGLSALYGFSILQDEKLSSRYAAHLWQGGLGLPDRDYYLSATPDIKQIRGEYRQHVEKMLTLLGDSAEAAKSGADAVLRIETQLAEASRTPVQLRDREAQYNKKSVADLAKLTPKLDWDRYFKAIQLDEVSDVIVGQPEFFERVNTMLTATPPADWQAYLRWHLVNSTASYLNDALEREHFHFYSEVLRGAKEMQPRWKRAIATLDGSMGEALGKMYVEKHFPEASKKRMDELVKNLAAAYADRLKSRDWMSDETKKQALIKLAAITPKIGYPDKWRDYSKLEIGADSYLQNVLRADAFEWRYRLAKLHKPVDRTEWGMTTPTVNAYYSLSKNEIVFPAGILQPPFFDPAADDAVNYGAIGAVIGHEITHGFDDQGSRSDAEGNLREWWTAEDRARFTAKTDKLVKQYDDCVALDDLHVNGRLTLGENIADLGGVIISYAAYQKSLAGHAAPQIDGFTGSQRFFLGYAQVLRGETRPAEARVRLRTDPHSPFRFRVLVPLSNVQAFYDAFDIQSGDAMYRPPADRVEIW